MNGQLHRTEGDRDFVRSLERGLEVIRALGHPGPGATLADVARTIGANRASTRRSLLGLEALGYVRSDGRLFSLTPKVLSLGYGYRSRLALPEVARPHLQRLMEETGEFSSLSVLDGDETVCVARVAPPRIMNVAMPVGTRLPAYATCVGRVLLAELPAQELDAYLDRVELRPLTPATLTSPGKLRAELSRVRHRRWALVDQELERGLRSAAAPVRDAAGHVIAAANVGAIAGRVTVAVLRKTLVPPLLASAASIERDLAIARP
ncbi:MAG: IclR family transcriptional regulator, pca regulon regulatory protein [Solirubrobacteraceae bacterium]